MRINLNLFNEYCENMDMPQVNELYQAFITMQTYVEQYELLCNDVQRDEIRSKLWSICLRKIISDSIRINEQTGQRKYI